MIENRYGRANLLLTSSKSYSWTRSESISFRGYFVVDDVLYKESRAISFLHEKLEDLRFEEVLPLLNGVFSVIVNRDNAVHFATDRVRGLPLFFATINGHLTISDRAPKLYDALPRVTFDGVSVEDYTKNELFVTGPYTLFQEIKQVQAGEWISFIEQKLCSGYYFLHADGIIDLRSEEELLKEFDPVFKKACRNLKLALDGRTAIVPLSGGVDSREVLLMLRTAECEKVLCFTYGKQGSSDCMMAAKVAEHFGYELIEIPYTRRAWQQLGRDQSYYDYLDFSGNYASLPHIQDILAVRILKERNLLPSDGVFVPGHTGSIVGGSLPTKFLMEEPVSYEELLKVVTKTYQDHSISPELATRVDSHFEPNACSTNDQAAAQHHCFVMKERQAKFIINSVRVFEFFGQEWLLPLCDLEFLEFFKRLPLPLKQNKGFIRSYMGLSHIPSTRDASLAKSVATTVRDVPVLRVPGRKISIFVKYFYSTLQIGGLYGFWSHLKGFLFGNEYFGSNSIASEKYFNTLKEKR